MIASPPLARYVPRGQEFLTILFINVAQNLEQGQAHGRYSINICKIKEGNFEV